MSDQQIISHYKRLDKINRRDIRLLCKLKVSVDKALEKQRLGHTDGWNEVQNRLNAIDDQMDCEELAKGHR